MGEGKRMKEIGMVKSKAGEVSHANINWCQSPTTVKYLQLLRAHLVSQLKHIFSFFKHYTYFHTLFHPHVFSHMFSNTYFQFLSACTKHPLSFIAITLQLQMLSKDPYILLPYLLNISLSCSPLIVLIRLLAAYIIY